MLAKPSKLDEFARRHKRAVFISKAIIDVVLLYCALLLLVTWQMQRAGVYPKAAIAAYESDVGLHAFRRNSGTPNALLANHHETATLYASKCTTMTTAMRRFQKKWLDINSYRGQTITSHFIVTELMTNREIAAVWHGCITPEAFDTFLAKIKRIRDHDSAVHSFGTMWTRFPVPWPNGAKMAFTTIHEFDRNSWEWLLNPRTVRLMRCAADPRCSPTRPSSGLTH